jgi:hypothetical protein
MFIGQFLTIPPLNILTNFYISSKVREPTFTSEHMKHIAHSLFLLFALGTISLQAQIKNPTATTDKFS